MTFWLIVGGWAGLCVLALRWTLPRLASSARELEHEEALEDDAEWDRRRPVERQRRLLAVADAVVESDWQQRARTAEGADDFRDDDTPRVA